MADTIKASVITDHPFRPRLDNSYLCGFIRHGVVHEGERVTVWVRI